jgi:ABC-type dipeptide/oligopeptide/nickel transport system ATPase subunit
VPDALLEIRGLRKSFAGRPALRGIDLDLDRGAALGLVGGSGSGKSTLARCIARLERPDAGEIRIGGALDYTHADVQVIFQEAAASLNPRFTAEEIVAEPLVIQRRGGPEERRKLARQWMETVGLSAGAAEKPAHAFSGGERQRLAIARALTVEPRLLLLDESFSGLDVLLQAQLTTLLRDLRDRLGLTLILISHDLALARRIADRIAVMDDGALVGPEHPRAVELAAASEFLSLRSALA